MSATNIGMHFFDMLVHVFGPIATNVVHLRERERAAGYPGVRPRCGSLVPVGRPRATCRRRPRRPLTGRLVIDGEELEFSDGFRDLHTPSAIRKSWPDAASGSRRVRPSIEIVSAFRNAACEPAPGRTASVGRTRHLK